MTRRPAVPSSFHRKHRDTTAAKLTGYRGKGGVFTYTAQCSCGWNAEKEEDKESATNTHKDHVVSAWKASPEADEG